MRLLNWQSTPRIYVVSFFFFLFQQSQTYRDSLGSARETKNSRKITFKGAFIKKNKIKFV